MVLVRRLGQVCSPTEAVSQSVTWCRNYVWPSVHRAESRRTQESNSIGDEVNVKRCPKGVGMSWDAAATG